MRTERSDPQGRVQVGGRRIYILPSRYGLMFATLLALMTVGALNYDNQPAFLLTFLLIGLGANAMYQTWRNLRGIQIERLPAEPVFCGQRLKLDFRLHGNDRTARYAIQLQAGEQLTVDDLPADGAVRTLSLSLPTQRRGPFELERLVISTRYPLGLFNAWSYVAPQGDALVYPKPGEGPAMPPQVQPAAEGKGRSGGEGQDDFTGLRDYRTGDTPKRIDWKSLARERGLMTKEFDAERDAVLRFDWSAMASNDVEWKLSQLTRAVCDAERAGVRYALHLPNQTFAADRGNAHYHACLAALACFDLPQR
jgi:uncharacterized protein (DUF58 family)